MVLSQKIMCESGLQAYENYVQMPSVLLVMHFMSGLSYNPEFLFSSNGESCIK